MDFKKRYKMLFEEIQRLYKMKSEIAKFYVDNKSRFEKNHEIIKELVNLKKKDVQKIKEYFIKTI